MAELSVKKRLGENTALYMSRLTYTNLSRLRVLSAVTLFVFSLLWIWDAALYLEGKWSESIGHQIVALTHSFLIVFLVGLQILFIKHAPKSPEAVKPYHGVVCAGVLAIGLYCTNFIALGDVLTHNSIAAYLGMIFAYASIFIMTNQASFILFGSNMVIMLALLVMVHWKLGKPMDNQIANAIAFTIPAFIFSRVLFYYHMNDFANRLVIDSQSLEIGQQDRLKAEISERKRAEEQMLAYQKRLLSMDVELAMAEEQERRRIAADLHDHIGQYLAISRIKLMSIRYAAEPETGTLLDEVLDMIKEMSQATRTLTMELSPSILFELGLEAALDWLAEHIASAHGLVVEFKWVDDFELSTNMNTMMFRIARELLLNVAKHAQASHVLFTVRSSDGYRWISIEDDGIGFDVSALDSDCAKDECFGLFSIRERLKPVDGRFEVQSVEGRGTMARIGIPLDAL